MPGDEKPKARPLKPVGACFATKDRAVAEEVARQMWQAAIFESQEQPADKVRTIAELVRAYLAFAKKYYRGPDGKTSRESQNVCYALTPLVEYCSTLLAEEFGPLKLKEMRERMIEKGWCRGVINQRIGIIKRMFKWAASEQFVPANVFHSLQTVDGLRRGRSGARETEPITPVAESHVRAILTYTTPTIAAMIELQLLTGMRSTEICLMRPCDIETSGRIWYYRPSEHKTSYRGHDRIVPIGPKGQGIIKPFLKRKLDAYCFTPADSEIHRPHPKQRDFNSRYNRGTYHRAVQYAIRAANKNRDEDNKIPIWNPHRVRHTAATKIRKELGLDAARAVLGHRNMRVTESYAEIDKALASKAALICG